MVNGKLFIFGKLDKLHNKYSLNFSKIGRDKKIIKLYDLAFNKMNLIFGEGSKSVIVENVDECV
jgi:hypothetical protein